MSRAVKGNPEIDKQHMQVAKAMMDIVEAAQWKQLDLATLEALLLPAEVIATQARCYIPTRQRQSEAWREERDRAIGQWHATHNGPEQSEAAEPQSADEAGRVDDVPSDVGEEPTTGAQTKYPAWDEDEPQANDEEVTS